MSDERIRLRREVPWGLIEFEQDPPKQNGWQHRAYFVTPADKRRRERYPSVTTFGGVLDKPALTRWKEDTGVRNAIAAERAGLLKDIGIDEVAGVIRDNRMGSEAALGAAASRGTDIHALIERYFTDGAVPNPADHPPEHRGYIRGAVRWLLSADARGIEPEASEQLVAHPDLRYAGRYDLRARLGGLAHIIDFKTGKGIVWPDHHYQPVAYGMADAACGAEPVHGCLIVAIGPEGTYQEMRSCADEHDVRALIDVYRRVQRINAAVKAERERLEALAA